MGRFRRRRGFAALNDAKRVEWHEAIKSGEHMTWIDVTDSAVKIGLGALIAGGFSFVVARLTQRAEYVKRRRDLIEKVMDMMNDFDKIYRHQKALFETLLSPAGSGGESGWADNKEYEDEFKLLDEKLRVAFEKFADASGILLLLGETDAESALDDYASAAHEWYDPELTEMIALPPAQLKKIRDKIDDKRTELMARMSDAYRKF